MLRYKEQKAFSRNFYLKFKMKYKYPSILTYSNEQTLASSLYHLQFIDKNLIPTETLGSKFKEI